MSLLPFINTAGTLEDGTYIHLLPFCKNNCDKEKCQKYYEGLKSCHGGSFRCPYGLSSFIYTTTEGKIIFTGLRIKGTYDKEKSKFMNVDTTFNPVIPEEHCISIAKEIAVTISEKNELKSKLDAINDLLHETRSLNGQVKNSIDQLYETATNESDLEYDDLLSALKNAHVCSHLIFNRFSYFDSILNPAVTRSSPYSAGVFKKFDKMRKLLKNYLRKNVWISLNTPRPCEFSYKITPSFETLLFIILENAIKYSPENNSVNVNFDEKGNSLDVIVESLGPYCEENELVHLCDKGFRGENARSLLQNGQGFGLSFAKKIATDHNIGLSFESIYSHKDHGIKYGIFRVKMHFQT